MKRFVAVLLTLAMLLGLASTALAEPRDLVYGLWWEIHYDSDDESWEDAEGATGKDIEIMQFDHVKDVEEQFNVKYHFENLTFGGVQDSINNSILAGEPDCDVYTVELGWGVPAAMNGLAVDLREVLDSDDPLFTGDDNVFSIVSLPDGRERKQWVSSPSSLKASDSYPPSEERISDRTSSS